MAHHLLATTTDRERIGVFNNTDTYSAQFVAALLGIMHDRVLHEAFAQYLALPSPAMIPYATQHIIIAWILERGDSRERAAN